MSGAAEAVELRAVGKAFGQVVALRDVSLQVHRGEFLSLLGPSGCGKSTTLSLIGGFEDASEGDILIDGRSVSGTPPHLRPVNTVFQSYALFPHMSVAENVEFGLRMKGVATAERARARNEMLHMVSLEAYGDRRPAQLSGGQRQRVALARALINRPAVLLLDEPLGALDLKLRKHMQSELTRLQRQVGITFVYVTHDQDEAMAMSDRIAVMDGGRLLQVGTPTEIYQLPQHRFVMDFMGVTNTLTGRVERVEGDGVELAIAGGGLARGRAMGGLRPGAAAALLVRAERLRLEPAGIGLPGRVDRVARMGFVTHYAVRLAGGQQVTAFRLDNADASGPAAEAAVGLTWDEADALVFPDDDAADGASAD